MARLIQRALDRAGLQAEAVGTAAEAESRLFEGQVDALVLDLGLPDRDGIRLLRDLRAGGDPVPTLVITARVSVDDRVAGLEAGADDYLTKPFALEELVARVRALLRRPGEMVQDDLAMDGLRFNSRTREASLDGNALTLTAKEQLVLELLLRNPGRVVGKSLLEDSLYGVEGERSSNALEVLIHRLRARLRAAGSRVAVHTVRGVGYMLATPPGEG